VTTSLTKHRLTEQAKAAVDDARRLSMICKNKITELEQSRQQALTEVNQRWGRWWMRSVKSRSPRCARMFSSTCRGDLVAFLRAASRGAGHRVAGV